MTESKAREFCKHNIHESHYCGSCNRDAINKLQSEIKAKDELLRECLRMLCTYQNMGGVRRRCELQTLLKKLREVKK